MLYPSNCIYVPHFQRFYCILPHNALFCPSYCPANPLKIYCLPDGRTCEDLKWHICIYMWPTAAQSMSWWKKIFLFFHVIWKQGIIATNWHIGCSVWPISFGVMAYKVMSKQRYSELRKLLSKVHLSDLRSFHTYPRMLCWKVGVWGGSILASQYANFSQLGWWGAGGRGAFVTW